MTEAGTLWIVGTPIGTLEDLPERARRVLAEVDVVLAEDTRRTRGLLTHFGIPSGRRLRSLHAHNEARATAAALHTLEAGRSVALVSDAGTPVLSDPGFELVRAARERGLPVRSVPGPSAFTAALAAAGLPPLPALLAGFPPPQAGPRRRWVASLAATPCTLVVLLSPHRLQAELDALAEGLGADRPAALLAELSKVHERCTRATLGELAAAAGEVGRGELVLVVGPPAPAAPARAEHDAVRHAYEAALGRGLPRPEALRAAARQLGLSRRAVFSALAEVETSDQNER